MITADAIGKSLKVTGNEVYLYDRFPASDSFSVKVKGQVLSKITSFIRKKNEWYYQLNDNQYILSKGVEVVSNNEKDTSNFFDRVKGSLGKFLYTQDKLKKEIADTIVDGTKTGFFETLDTVKKLGLAIIGLLIISTLIKIIK